MPKYTDEDGNEVEIKETIEELQEKAEELTKEKEKLEKTIKGESNKEYNFKQLLEKKKLGEEKLTKSEALVLELNEKINDINKNNATNLKEKAVNRLVGSDEELKTKVMESYKTIKVKANTESEVAEKMGQAYTLATGQSPKINPINTVSGDLGGNSPESGVKSKMSEETKNFGSKNFQLTEDDYKTAEEAETK